MSNRAELSRRALIKVIGGAGTCLVLGGFSALACASPAAADGLVTPRKPGKIFQPNAFIKVEPDGTATITITRQDMGQGVRTSLAMLVADEMDLDWKKVHVVQATSDPGRFGRQGTGGSSSVRGMHEQLRQMGATARAMLVAAAAKQWGVDPTTCTTADGFVIHAASKRSIAYGDLTGLASSESVPGGEVKLKDPAEFKIIGKPTSRVDNPAVTRGSAKYGLDSKTPGMVYAVLSRPPARGATVKSVDDSAARKVAGVLDVIQVNGGVAVIGKNTWAALKGRNALNIDWDLGKNGDLTTDTIREKLKGGVIEHVPMPDGARVFDATFDFPYLAHATMEPMNALVHITDGGCEVWAPTQQPDGVRGAVAGLLKIPQENVTINVTLLGGGFGRRLFGDYVQEAVGIAQVVKKPVQLVWSREDDMKHDYYRPACHTSVRAALDATGKPVGWSHQCIQAQRGGTSFGNSELPYDIPGAKRLMGGVSTAIQTGPWRSVEHTLTVSADECFIDELAHHAGKDPFEFRRDLIRDERLRNVLELAAKHGDWGKPMPKGHGRGIACFAGYGSYVAHVIELSVEKDEIMLHRAVVAVDCGMAVNPRGVEAQIQGALTDGLSVALRAEITIDKGGAVQNSWTDYNWMTMDAMPKIEVHMIQGARDPGGMGEPPFPSVPPPSPTRSSPPPANESASFRSR